MSIEILIFFVFFFKKIHRGVAGTPAEWGAAQRSAPQGRDFSPILFIFLAKIFFLAYNKGLWNN